MRICYVNGRFVEEDKANISIFDRGFLFSDGVYEVSLVVGGQLIDNAGHLARLSRSLAKLGIAQPLSNDEISKLQYQLITKNQLHNGGLYLQVTRGNDGDRNFLPNASTKPSLVIFPQHHNVLENPLSERGLRVISVPEIRWAKRDIKATSLLGAVLAKQAAQTSHCDDAWFVEDGFVTEGSSNNAYFIKDKHIVTKAANAQILDGITRRAVFNIAEEHQLTLVERDFTISEAQAADEAFVSSAVLLIAPVVEIDGVTIGDGQPGPLVTKLRQIYIEMALSGKFS